MELVIEIGELARRIIEDNWIPELGRNPSARIDTDGIRRDHPR